MAKKKAETEVKVSLNWAAFEQGAKAVLKWAKEMYTFLRDSLSVAVGNVLASAFNKAASTIGKFLTSVKQGVLDAINLGEEMAKLSNATGIAAGDFQAFQISLEKGLSFAAAKDILGGNSEVLNRSANLFREVSLRLFEAGERIKGFFLGVAEAVAPVMNVILADFNATSLVEAGRQFGEYIANAVRVVYQLFREGKLWDTVKLAFALGVAELQNGVVFAGEYLRQALPIIFRGAGEYLVAYFKALGIGLPKILIGGFIEAFRFLFDFIKNNYQPLFTYLAQDFGRKMAEAIINAVAPMAGLLGLALPNLAAIAGKSVGEAPSISGEEQGDGRSLLQQGLDDFKAVPAVVIDTFGQLRRLFDQLEKKDIAGASEIAKQIKEVIDSATARFKELEKAVPTRENRYALQNFAADSLTQVGGGGGVGGGRFNLIDVNKQQLDVQRQQLQTLNDIKASVRPASGSVAFGAISADADYGVGISLNRM